MAVSALVLAASAERRSGQPIIYAIVGDIAASRVDRIGVVIGDGAAELAPMLAGRGVTMVLNAAWDEGIAASIRAGMHWASMDDAVLICRCDQRNVSSAHLDALIEAHLATGRTAATRYGDVVTVPAVFGRDAYPALAALRGDVGASTVIGSDAVAVDGPEEAWPGAQTGATALV
jgi:CTP:molybdopterin cytidylyltransferase MocA